MSGVVKGREWEGSRHAHGRVRTGQDRVTYVTKAISRNHQRRNRGIRGTKQHIDSKIAELRNMLDHRDGAAEAPKLKRKISAASRRRRALAQKKRWAAIKGQSQAMSPARSESPKRRISEEGMKRIIAATKRRWARKRAEEAKAKRAGLTRNRARKVTTPKAA